MVDRPQNYKGLYGILQPLQGHLDNYPLENPRIKYKQKFFFFNFISVRTRRIKVLLLLKTPKLCWIAFHSVTLQLKCLDFQSNQYMMLMPVFSGFCNKLSSRQRLFEGWITLTTG